MVGCFRSYDQTAAEELDSDTVMIEVSKSPDSRFDRLDLAVQPLGGSAGNPTPEVGQQSCQMFLEHAREFLDRGQATADRKRIFFR